MTTRAAGSRAAQMAFACLPHGLTQKAVGALPEHIKVVDLSADFRPASPQFRALARACALLTPLANPGSCYHRGKAA